MSHTRPPCRGPVLGAILLGWALLGWALLGSALLGSALPAQTTIAEATRGMAQRPGFVTVYRDAVKDRLLLLIDRLDTDLLYIDSLPFGVGSNDVGLDRGKLGATRVVRFHRAGPRVMLIQRNLAHRAVSDDRFARRAVEEAFAQSVLWGFDVVAASGEQVLVDATGFCLRDAFGVARTLQRQKQGTFTLDPKRSFLDWEGTAAFPKNTELQAVLTFAGTAPGPQLRPVVPTPGLLTVRQRHSFVELPDDGYRPRRFDPRTGYSPVTFQDYAAPIDKPLVQQFIRRHRLVPKDPGRIPGPAAAPIVYYLDRGAPEPVRSALLDGARWWAKAFAAAGFTDAFRVELLPEDADPMDVRYNVIQWVHRSSRGWSYGNSVTDPRTGEILKGHVTLGSRRVRQDFLIAQALVGPDRQRCEAMALARLRQLAAHEVGHTLGLVHNFAASAHRRASVMDYPHPQLGLGQDGVDLSDAYGVGVGAWDEFAIRWGYTWFPPGETRAGLDALVQQAHRDGLRFLSDRDARPAGGMHPAAHLWDNGVDPVQELRRVLAVRQFALARFGPGNLAPGEPLTLLDELITPLYLLHRYQVDAVSKLVGGVDYAIAMPGDPRTRGTPVPDEIQRDALRGLLSTLDPEVLSIPERIAQAIPPRTHGSRRERELLPSRAEPAFDPLAAAEAGARDTLRFLLHPGRAARLFQQHAGDPSRLALAEVLEQLLAATVKAPPARPRDTARDALRETVGHAVIDEVIGLAAHADAPAPVRRIARSALVELEKLPAAGAFAPTIRRFLEHPEQFTRHAPPELPPGSPIGCACGHDPSSRNR